MHNANKKTYWMAGAVALVLIVFFLLPRHIFGLPQVALSQGGGPVSEATVPAQILSDQPGAVQAPVPAPTDVAVYVCGDVRRPGVYALSSKLRVTDAIKKAGGALTDADLDQLNLAQPLVDAMKIEVPKQGQVLASASGLAPAGGLDGNGMRRGRHSGRSSHKLQPGQTLDVNTATESELTALPGVGPGLARRIVEYRAANGPFQSVDDLQNVSGIGPSKFDRMQPYVRL